MSERVRKGIRPSFAARNPPVILIVLESQRSSCKIERAPNRKRTCETLQCPGVGQVLTLEGDVREELVSVSVS